MKRLLAHLAAAIVLLALAAVVYVRVGWDRMEVACPEGPSPSVALSWSFPDGFRCDFGNGAQQSSLLLM